MLSLNKGQSIQSQGAKLLKMFKVTRKSHKVHRLCCIFESSEEAFKNPPTQPWPLWFSGLCVGLQTKVRTHAWVVGKVPSAGCARGNHTLIFLSLSLALPLSL